MQCLFNIAYSGNWNDAFGLLVGIPISLIIIKTHITVCHEKQAKNRETINVELDMKSALLRACMSL